MSVEWIQAIAAAGGLVLAVVGVPLVYLQLRGVQRALHGAAHAAIYQQAADLRGHLMEHPALRRYLFDDVDISPEHEEYQRVLTLAELMLNYLEHITVLGESFGRENRPALDRFTRTALERSPVVRRHLAENAAAYSAALLAVAREVTPAPPPSEA